MTTVDDLLEAAKKGCKVGFIEDKDAKAFIAGCRTLYNQGKKLHVKKAVQILKEHWSRDIERRRFAEHLRGECTCPKTK